VCLPVCLSRLRAVKEYSDALACDDLSAKDRSVILCNRAQVYLRQKSYAAAVEDCTSSLTLAPDSVKAMFRRATALEMLGNIDDAIKDYREVLKMDPSVSDATTALQRCVCGWMCVGVCVCVCVCVCVVSCVVCCVLCVVCACIVCVYVCLRVLCVHRCVHGMCLGMQTGPDVHEEAGAAS
jgi:tetratricopeptide (TPR) repeat protein